MPSPDAVALSGRMARLQRASNAKGVIEGEAFFGLRAACCRFRGASPLASKFDRRTGSRTYKAVQIQAPKAQQQAAAVQGASYPNVQTIGQAGSLQAEQSRVASARVP